MLDLVDVLYLLIAPLFHALIYSIPNLMKLMHVHVLSSYNNYLDLVDHHQLFFSYMVFQIYHVRYHQMIYHFYLLVLIFFFP